MEKTYTSCRKDYPVFYYTHYEVHETASDLAVTYHFEIPGLSSFAPTWCFPKKAEDCTCWSEDPTLLRTIFSLGMVELVSYWKIACPPKVVVQAGIINETQISWWKKLYYQGLGEFFTPTALKLILIPLWICSVNRLKIQPESQTYYLSQVLLWRQIRLLLTAVV